MERPLLALLAAFVSLPVAGQQSAAPDPRLEQLVNRIMVAEVQRSVQIERVFPRPAAPLERRRAPALAEPDMVRAAEGLYIERGLAPRMPATLDPGAVRVYPRDAR